MGSLHGRTSARPRISAREDLSCTHDDSPIHSAGRRALLCGMAGSVGLGALPAYAQTGRRPGGQPDASRFMRLFPQLPQFGEASPQMMAALVDIGKAGGIMDARDNLTAGPAALILDPALNVNNVNAQLPEGTAGTTFMGQFIDHDMTFDTTSRLGVRDPAASVAQRAHRRHSTWTRCTAPGRWPIRCYTTRATRRKFKVEGGGLFEDLPRTADGSGDRRATRATTRT